jgi:poly(3-hydroxybutyrate) depolymerase
MTIGRGTSATRLAALAVVLFAGVAAAASTPDDLTGQWLGMGQEDGKAAMAVTADLTSRAGSRRFDGTAMIADDPPLTCTVMGRERRNLKVNARLACAGGVLRLHGTFDPATQTLTGGYVRRGHHRRHVGTFTLTKQAS